MDINQIINPVTPKNKEVMALGWHTMALGWRIMALGWRIMALGWRIMALGWRLRFEVSTRWRVFHPGAKRPTRPYVSASVESDPGGAWPAV